MVRVEVPLRYRRPDAVREALAGRIEQLPPSVALAMVPDLDIAESEQRRILHEALEDRELEASVRAQAVDALASLGAESAVEELVGILEQPGLEAEVASRAVAILGRVAGREQLDQLEAVREAAATEALREQAAFARALIVHRLGLAQPRVDLPTAERLPTPEGAGAAPFVSREMGFPRRNEAIEGVQRRFPHVESRGHEVYELRCGRRLMAVVVRKDLVADEGAEKLGEGPALPAIVAELNEETGDFFPTFVALTRPTDRGRISLLLARLTGQPVFLGTGSVESNGLGFRLASANAPGATAVDARVRTAGGALEITGMSGRRAAVPGLAPRRIRPPIQ